MEYTGVQFDCRQAVAPEAKLLQCQLFLTDNIDVQYGSIFQLTIFMQTKAQMHDQTSKL